MASSRLTCPGPGSSSPLSTASSTYPATTSTNAITNAVRVNARVRGAERSRAARNAAGTSSSIVSLDSTATARQAPAPALGHSRLRRSNESAKPASAHGSASPSR